MNPPSIIDIASSERSASEPLPDLRPNLPPSIKQREQIAEAERQVERAASKPKPKLKLKKRARGIEHTDRELRERRRKN